MHERFVVIFALTSFFPAMLSLWPSPSTERYEFLDRRTWRHSESRHAGKNIARMRVSLYVKYCIRTTVPPNPLRNSYTWTPQTATKISYSYALNWQTHVWGSLANYLGGPLLWPSLVCVIWWSREATFTWINHHLWRSLINCLWAERLSLCVCACMCVCVRCEFRESLERV